MSWLPVYQSTRWNSGLGIDAIQNCVGIWIRDGNNTSYSKWTDDNDYPINRSVENICKEYVPCLEWSMNIHIIPLGFSGTRVCFFLGYVGSSTRASGWARLGYSAANRDYLCTQICFLFLDIYISSSCFVFPKLGMLLGYSNIIVLLIY